jgi:predicted benzoate:H+ symporter BenE
MFRSWKFGLALALGCLALIIVGGVTRPFGLLDHEAPPATARRVTAGVMLLLNVEMYSGVGISLIEMFRRLLVIVRCRREVRQRNSS